MESGVRQDEDLSVQMYVEQATTVQAVRDQDAVLEVIQLADKVSAVSVSKTHIKIKFNSLLASLVQ